MDYNKKIILYGLSMFKDNVIRMLGDKYGSWENAKEHILFFSDSNSLYWGGVYCGIDIKAPSEILNYPDAVVCILSYKFDVINRDLRRSGVKNEIYMTPFLIYRTYYDLELGKKFINKHEDEIIELYQQNDSYTVNLLKHIINERKSGKEEFQKVELFEGLSEVGEYFYDDGLNCAGEKTWIDVGAYTGDSIELAYKRFGDSIKKYYALEPSKNNINALRNTIDRLQISNKSEILEYGLGSEERIEYFNENGPLSNVDNENGSEAIQIKPLDLLNLCIVGTPYIKMDIEGAEMSALKGMKNFISEKRPYLAVCVYHRIEDILAVPSYIREIDRNYRFYLRAGMHTECYAIPK
ncbi:MAG: FkbM family methyltransferase [Lachnospiraceae bacterium]|nr:FkbM family methyltransferase [Lachnospiraceae bacterium]